MLRKLYGWLKNLMRHRKAVQKAKSCIEILRKAYNSTCAEECKGQWIHSTLLAKNEIPLDSFSAAIYDTGKISKYIHLWTSERLISPLKKLHNAFSNPATGTFAWVGAENAEIVLLNDFWWLPSINAWDDQLQLLEGDIVHLPGPKNFLMKDISPIYTTEKF